MEAKNQNLVANRFEVDDVHMTNIVEWNKKRKLQIDQLDLLRPKHKCRVRSFPSEQDSIFDENLRSERVLHDLPVKGSKLEALVLEDRTSPVSAGDSNSFAEDSDASMSVNEELKLEAGDCANTFLYGRPSKSFVKWNDYNAKDITKIEKTIINSSDEDDLFNQSYNHEADIQALQNLEEQIRGYEKLKDHHLYGDDCEESLDKGFEDLYSTGVNPNVYVLSSGRWEVNQEADSSTRPPTIDQEFEEYFSMLML